MGKHKGRLQAVEDGAEVFGLRVVTTPGHTPGHIAVFDADSAVLAAGDALTTTFDGILSGPSRPSPRTRRWQPTRYANSPP